MCERNGNVTGSSASGRRSSLASTTLNNQPVTQLTYDQIGNRITCNNTHYRPNACNQYEDLSYDSDGNMTMYDGWALTWNGENRLIRMIKGTAKLEFAYDYMGRRYEKKVYANDVLTKHQRFIYDGYKLIEIRNALNNNALTHSFVWRKVPQDVPYSMKYGNTTYYYVTDANKNVVCLLSGYSSAADYQYGPWGEIREVDGTAAYWNPFRFSSEFYDDETGLVYYNYRYYSPALGRWLSRDPIGEEGGMNLYAMCGNNAIYMIDLLGLEYDGCCGDNVTKKLNNLILKLKEQLTSDKYKNIFISYSMFHVGAGWDMYPFFNDARAIDAKTKCSATRSYSGKCYKSSSINYILWGILAAARQYHYQKYILSSDYLKISSLMDNEFDRNCILEHVSVMIPYLLLKIFFLHDEKGEDSVHSSRCKAVFFRAGIEAFDTGSLPDIIEKCSVNCKYNDDETTSDLKANFFIGKELIEI